MSLRTPRDEQFEGWWVQHCIIHGIPSTSSTKEIARWGWDGARSALSGAMTCKARGVPCETPGACRTDGCCHHSGEAAHAPLSESKPKPALPICGTCHGIASDLGCPECDFSPLDKLEQTCSDAKERDEGCFRAVRAERLLAEAQAKLSATRESVIEECAKVCDREYQRLTVAPLLRNMAFVASDLAVLLRALKSSRYVLDGVKHCPSCSQERTCWHDQGAPCQSTRAPGYMGDVNGPGCDPDVP